MSVDAEVLKVREFLESLSPDERNRLVEFFKEAWTAPTIEPKPTPLAITTAVENPLQKKYRLRW